MKIEELIKIIHNISGITVNQSMLAEAFGITRQTISNRIKSHSEVTVSEIERAEKHFKISIFNSVSDIAIVEYYTDDFVTNKDNEIIYSDIKTKLPIPLSIISGYSADKIYSMINASGNSMAPTINNGDKLIIEHLNKTHIQDNKIYAFCFNNEFFVKRLSKNLDDIIIKSDNPEYQIKTINIKSNPELILIGKIVATIRQFE